MIKNFFSVEERVILAMDLRLSCLSVISHPLPSIALSACLYFYLSLCKSFCMSFSRFLLLASCFFFLSLFLYLTHSDKQSSLIFLQRLYRTHTHTHTPSLRFVHKYTQLCFAHTLKIIITICQW